MLTCKNCPFLGKAALRLSCKENPLKYWCRERQEWRVDEWEGEEPPKGWAPFQEPSDSPPSIHAPCHAIHFVVLKEKP